MVTGPRPSTSHPTTRLKILNSVALSGDNKDGYWQALTYQQFIFPDPRPTDSKLASVTDAFGRQISFRYSTSKDATHPTEGLLSAVTDVDGLSVNYEYQWIWEPVIGADAYAVNLVAATQKDQTVRRYSYAEPASFPTYGPVRATHLTGLQDELGVRIGTYKYDASGLAISTRVCWWRQQAPGFSERLR